MTKAIAKKNESIFAFSDEGKKGMEAIKKNTGSAGLGLQDLDSVKVPAGGGTSFSVPELSGDVDHKTIEGVIVSFSDTRSYWEGEYTGGNEAPECSSSDGLVGVGKPGGKCGTCVMSKFAEDGTGQPCKERRVMYILRNEGLLPIVVSAPTMSLRPLRKYFLRLASAGKQFNHVITSLCLVVEQNKGGIKYSAINAQMVRELTEDEVKASDFYYSQISPQDYAEMKQIREDVS